MEIRILPYASDFPAKGSMLMKEFSNIGTPILDSLVRESIQNSLDAANQYNKPVIMKFKTGDFEKKRLFAQCEKLEKMLAPKFSDIPCRYLSFRDYNTEGLTGDVVDKGDQNPGNYFKLVKDIGNEQTRSGAGGSYGVGKSLYFRLGVKGFVIYYSRIKHEHGKHESRLIALMVENERGHDSVIPPAEKGKSKTGIAYWGILKNDNILPLTKEKEIKEVLDIFNIEPYKGDETGTAVILPFIDEASLLAKNQKTFGEGENEIIPTWRHSISDFLEMSIQRWYFARLNNNKYKNGKWLYVSINDKPLDSHSMVPCFKVFQALYNRAAGVKNEDLDDIIEGNENVVVEEVALGRYRPLDKKKTGTLAYILADTKLLGMMPPSNNYSPYIYCDTNLQDNNVNPPIIGYCRQPGMIVNYETSGDWLYRVPNSPDEEHYLLVVFVLNSKNKLGDDDTLEEYVRSVEPNDHMRWVDGEYKGENYSFIRLTKNKVSNILYSNLSEGEQADSKRKMSELGKLYSWILPPEDFGKRSSPRTPSPGSGKPKPRTSSKLLYTIDSQELNKDNIIITYNLETLKKRNNFVMELLVSTTDGKNIALEDWEKMGADIPFYIQSAQISLKKIEGKSSSKMIPLSSSKLEFNDEQTGLNVKLDKTPGKSVPNALNLNFKAECMFKVVVKLTIKISSRTALPTINIV